jgi:ribonuclease E
VLENAAYATRVGKTEAAEEPITAEGEAEKPTRRAPAKKTEVVETGEAAVAEEVEEPDEPEEPAEVEALEEAPKPKKKTRRGSRGGRGRKKSSTAAPASGNGATPVAAKIHVPDPDLGQAEAPAEGPVETLVEEPIVDGAGPPKPKKKTRRGTRGGRGRKKKTAPVAAGGQAATAEGAKTEPEPAPEPEEGWDYVPMSEWADDLPEG